MAERQSANIARFLSVNLVSARRGRELSQSRLAALAGVPRSTISHIESGSGNPSLARLAAIADALSVGIDELISPPRAHTLLLEREALPMRNVSSGAVTIRRLVPERIRGLEVERLEFAPRAIMKGTPHIRGTREYLHVLTGRLDILLAGEFHPVTVGQVLAFAGDQHHSYRNPEAREATAVSIVIPVTAQGPPT